MGVFPQIIPVKPQGAGAAGMKTTDGRGNVFSGRVLFIHFILRNRMAWLVSRPGNTPVSLKLVLGKDHLTNRAGGIIFMYKQVLSAATDDARKLA